MLQGSTENALYALATRTLPDQVSWFAFLLLVAQVGLREAL